MGGPEDGARPGQKLHDCSSAVQVKYSFLLLGTGKVILFTYGPDTGSQSKGFGPVVMVVKSAVLLICPVSWNIS